MLCYAVCVIESNRSFGTWTGAYVIALILSCHRLLMEFFSPSLLTLSISEGKKREEKKTHYEAGKDRYLPSYPAPLLYVCVCVLGLHLWSLTHPHHLELNIYCIYVHCMRENNLKFKEDFCCIWINTRKRERIFKRLIKVKSFKNQHTVHTCLLLSLS